MYCLVSVVQCGVVVGTWDPLLANLLVWFSAFIMGVTTYEAAQRHLLQIIINLLLLDNISNSN